MHQVYMMRMLVSHVDNATDVAKASADIILLEKSLTVILNGIYEGRRILWVIS